MKNKTQKKKKFSKLEISLHWLNFLALKRKKLYFSQHAIKRLEKRFPTLNKSSSPALKAIIEHAKPILMDESEITPKMHVKHEKIVFVVNLNNAEVITILDFKKNKIIKNRKKQRIQNWRQLLTGDEYEPCA